MTFKEAFKDVSTWIGANYPAYAGWELRSFHWEYDLCAYPASQVEGAINDVMERLTQERFGGFDMFERGDLKDLVERIQPPEGHAYVTVQNGNVRVGLNVPAGVFKRSVTASAA